MKEEKLELKHLAPYLPYGLKCIDCDSNIQRILRSIFVKENGINCIIGKDLSHITNIKPILHPLSDLTKEIEHNGKKFVPKDDLFKLKEVHQKTFPMIDNFELWDITCIPYWVVQKLHEWHFDIERLIGKGLAISYNDIYETCNGINPLLDNKQ